VKPVDREALEAQLAHLFEAGKFDETATVAVSGYGPELLGFLVALHADPDEAAEVFAQLCEDLWRGLPGFERRASFRTWLYTLTRHASHRYRRTVRRRARRNLPLSECPALSAIEQQVRTSTLPHLKSQTKARLAALRSSLTVEEQTILILRVDKGLDWNELARVLGDGEEPGPAELARASARLRKRFQQIKTRLRELAAKEGLLGSPE
jgi:RNA polymerase sigma-70 factor (ECF subfamily)